MVGFTREDFENIRNTLFDPDGGADAVFWLHATTAYIALRVSLELLFPTNIRGYTAQQYIVTLLHQACSHSQTQALAFSAVAAGLHARCCSLSSRCRSGTFL
eukprot:6200590-Pleurochrysis_carterae.AAC.3